MNNLALPATSDLARRVRLSRGGFFPVPVVGLFELASWPSRRRRRRLLSRSFRAWTSEGREALDRGDHTTAERLFRFSVDSLQQDPWMDPDVGISLEAAEGFARLGEIHGGTGAYTFLAGAIEDTRSKGLELGQDSVEFADSLMRLGFLYRVLTGKTWGVGVIWYSAQQDSMWSAVGAYLQDRALGILEGILGSNQRAGADSLQTLARFHFGGSQPGAWDQRVLQVREGELGRNHPDVADSLEWCAEAAVPERKQELLTRALQIRIDAFGRHHPKVARAMEGLAECRLHSDEERKWWEVGETLLRDALALREEIQGAWHPDVADTLVRIYRFLDHRNRWREATEVLDRALTILLRANAADRPEWHGGQEIFEFVLPVSEGDFARFERLTVTETSAHRMSLATDSARRDCIRSASTLQEVAESGADVSASSLDRLGDAIKDGYRWVWEREGLPPECYRLEDMVDPLHFGSMPADWRSTFQRFRDNVAPHRMTPG